MQKQNSEQLVEVTNKGCGTEDFENIDEFLMKSDEQGKQFY